MRSKTSLILILSGLLFAGAPAFAGDTSPPSHAYVKVPQRPFLISYFEVSRQFDYSVHHHARMPIVWLYNPAGKAVEFFSRSKVLQLRRIMNSFPQSLSGAKALAKEPSLQAVRKILHKANGEIAKIQPAASQWTAVILLPPVPGGKCGKCAEFLHAVKAAAKRSQGQLHLVTVQLTIPSGD